MTVVYLFLGVLVVGMAAWYVVQTRRARRDQFLVSEHWIEQHRYRRNGDPPPGTSRQEEGR